MTVREMKHAAKCEIWTRRITECRQSGLTVAKWCREQNLDKSSYYRWERQLLKGVNPQEELLPASYPAEAAAPFVEVPLPSTQPCPVARTMDTVARIHAGGLSIDLSNHTSPELLAFLKDVIAGAG